MAYLFSPMNDGCASFFSQRFSCKSVFVCPVAVEIVEALQKVCSGYFGDAGGNINSKHISVNEFSPFSYDLRAFDQKDPKFLPTSPRPQCMAKRCA